MNGYVYDEYYEWVLPSTMRLIKRYNVSPSDYWTLHDYYESDYREVERCIKTYSKNGNYQEFQWMNAEIYV